MITSIVSSVLSPVVPSLLLLLHLLPVIQGQSVKNCDIAGLRVNCTSVTLSSVPIIFNPRLTDLTLRDTGISQLGQSRPLDVYTRVQFLDLSQNSLRNIPDEAFRNQKVLRVLNVSSNALSSLTTKPFDGLQSLEILVLTGNQINETSVVTFSSLPNLKFLSLSDNRLTEVPTDVLRQVSSLETLHIGGNLFEEILSDSFPLTGLKSLDLSHCLYLEAIRDAAFAGAGNLEQLVLSHNPLLRLHESGAFAGLSKLQVLNLSFNKLLSHLEPELFAPLVGLRFLSLQSCALSVIDVRIANLAVNLQFLDVRDNSLTCNCSVQWIRSHFLSQRNHSSSSPPIGSSVLAAAVVAALPNYPLSGTEETQQTLLPAAETTTAAATAALPQYLSLDWLTRREEREEPLPHKSAVARPVLSLLPEERMSRQAVQLLLRHLEEARCSDPTLVRDKRLIDLGPEMTGCFRSESLAPIVILALSVGFAVAVILILVLRFRERVCRLFRKREHQKRKQRPQDLSRSAFLPSSLSLSSKFNPTPVSTLHVNNNRKVFHGLDAGSTMKGQRLHPTLARMPFDEFGSLSSKPEFIFVHNTINLRGNNRSIGNLGNGGHDASLVRSDFIEPIYRSRHVINNVRNNPYEVVPIVPPVAASSHRNGWPHQHPDQLPYHMQTHQFTDPCDPDDPFNFYERTYEEAHCPISHLTPSTEL